MMIKIYTKYLFLFTLALITVHCNHKKINEKQIPLAKWSFDFENEEAWNKRTDGAIAGKYYSRVDSLSMYGYGLAIKIPDSLKGKHLRVSVDFLSRLMQKRFGQSLVIAVQNKDKVFYWYAIDLSPLTFKKSKWFVVKDSVQFYYNPTDTNAYELKVFGFNPYKHSMLDIDDLKIDFKEIQYINND